MRFARLSRRDCIMLLGASLSGLADIRSVPSQEIPRIPPSGEYQPWGFDLSGADLGIKPGDDFFRYSNGAWFDHAVISPDHDTNSVDTALSDIAEGRIRYILMSGGTSVELSAREDAAKAGVFYSNFMDEARAEALDANPIAPFVRMLRQAETRADLAELMPKPFFMEIFRFLP
jgi:predicted metalloendopeptidase